MSSIILDRDISTKRKVVVLVNINNNVKDGLKNETGHV